MEALVALLILGMLMTTIVSIIRFSSAMTVTFITGAADEQSIVNDLMLEDFAGRDTAPMNFRLRSAATAPVVINASHQVLFTSEDNLTAFFPD